MYIYKYIYVYMFLLVIVFDSPASQFFFLIRPPPYKILDPPMINADVLCRNCTHKFVQLY